MTNYTAKIVKEDNDNYLVEFPDLEGCLTEGETLQEALSNAKEALDGWLAASCDRDLKIPEPKFNKTGKNYFLIPVDIKIEFAIKLRRIRKKRGLSQSEVARLLGISQQAYAKFESPDSTNPSLNTIQKLSDALDIEIELKLVA